MLLNLSQLRQNLAQAAGIQNSNGVYDFDDTTFPTEDQAEFYINQSLKEIASSWDYTFLQTSRSYPFNHVISGVQAVYLSGFDSAGSGIGLNAIVTPYPTEVLNYSQLSNQYQTPLTTNFSGIFFSGVSSGISYSAKSVLGNPAIGIYSGVGYTYQLNEDVDKIIALMLSNSNGGSTSRAVMMKHIDWHDMERVIPIGVINSSGTPVFYSEFPGFGPINNKTIQFFPTPTSSFSTEAFIVHYKKKHVDLIQETDTQSVIPEQYQNIIIQASLEKVFDLLDNPKAELASSRKNELEGKMRVWDSVQPNKMWQWTDFNYNSLSDRAYDNSQLLFLPYD